MLFRQMFTPCPYTFSSLRGMAEAGLSWATTSKAGFGRNANPFRGNKSQLLQIHYNGDRYNFSPFQHFLEINVTIRHVLFFLSVGCGPTTISSVSHQMRITMGIREPPEHGLKKWHRENPRKPTKSFSDEVDHSQTDVNVTSFSPTQTPEQVQDDPQQQVCC